MLCSECYDALDDVLAEHTAGDVLRHISKGLRDEAARLRAAARDAGMEMNESLRDRQGKLQHAATLIELADGTLRRIRR